MLATTLRIVALCFATYAAIGIVFLQRGQQGLLGDSMHKTRGFRILGAALASVIINTISLSMRSGLAVDPPFMAHISVGVLCFVGLLGSILTGLSLEKKGGQPARKIHLFCAMAAATGIVLVFVTGFGMALLRT